VVSIHEGVGVTGLSGCGTGGGVPADLPVDRSADLSPDLPRPTTKVCPQVVH
jgi:hypothetical protein